MEFASYPEYNLSRKLGTQVFSLGNYLGQHGRGLDNSLPSGTLMPLDVLLALAEVGMFRVVGLQVL